MLSADEATSDRPVPSGVAPYRITATSRAIVVRSGTSRPVRFQVLSASGAPLALENPLNRLVVRSTNPRVATATVGADGATVTVTGRGRGRAWLVAVYQRERASGGYTTVHQGRGAQPVAVRLATVVWR